MRQFLLQLSLSISLILISFGCINAQNLYPGEDGQVVRGNALIEMEKGYVSGICIMRLDSGIIYGSIVNEFGISAIDFTYNTEKEKIELKHVIGMLNKWYIKRVLKNDLKKWLISIQQGENKYVNEKRKITYTLTPIFKSEEDETE